MGDESESMMGDVMAEKGSHAAGDRWPYSRLREPVAVDEIIDFMPYRRNPGGESVMGMEENELGVLEIRDDSATRIAIAAMDLAIRYVLAMKEADLEVVRSHGIEDGEVIPMTAHAFAQTMREIEKEISR